MKTATPSASTTWNLNISDNCLKITGTRVCSSDFIFTAEFCLSFFILFTYLRQLTVNMPLDILQSFLCCQTVYKTACAQKHTATQGVSKGESMIALGISNTLPAFPFGRLEGPGTIRKVPGGSLHTFSPVRKYVFPLRFMKTCKSSFCTYCLRDTLASGTF